MSSIRFTISGEPFGKKRPRAVSFGGHPRIHNDPENERYELKVMNAYQNEYGKDKPMLFSKEAYISATIVAIYTIPKAMSKKKRQQAIDGYIRPTKRPDLDNIAKSILDGLNTIAYHDDSQVVDLLIVKRYGEEAKVMVELVERNGKEDK